MPWKRVAHQQGKLHRLEKIANDSSRAASESLVTPCHDFAHHGEQSSDTVRWQLRSKALMVQLAVHLVYSRRVDLVRQFEQALEQDLNLESPLGMLVSSRSKRLADLLEERVATGPDLVTAVLAVVDRFLFQHIDATNRGSDHREPFVMQPLAGKRTRAVEQGAAKHGCSARHKISSQEGIEGATCMDIGEFETLDLQCVKKRFAQIVALRVDQSRIGMQQYQARAALEFGAHAAKAMRVPDVVLIGQCNQFAAATPSRLIKIACHPERRNVFDDIQRDVPLRQLDKTFFQRALRHGHAIIGGRIVRQHDLNRRMRLKADAADLLTNELRTVVRAERYGNVCHAASARRH